MPGTTSAQDDGTGEDERSDHVDAVLAQWARERPDLDVSGMAVLGRLARVQQLVGARLGQVFAEHDLEAWEFDVLATLRRNGAPYALTPGQLLGQMMVSSGAMTNRIDRLAGRGLVERRSHPTDGRQVLVALTGPGRVLVDRAVTAHAANESAVLAALDAADLEQLGHLLRRLHASLVPDDAT